MLLAEAREAMVTGTPVKYKDMVFQRISGIICRMNKKGDGYRWELELYDRCGHSVVIARMENVEIN